MRGRVSCLNTVGLTFRLSASLVEVSLSELLVLLLGFVLTIACYRREVG